MAYNSNVVLIQKYAVIFFDKIIYLVSQKTKVYGRLERRILLCKNVLLKNLKHRIISHRQENQADCACVVIGRW